MVIKSKPFFCTNRDRTYLGNSWTEVYGRWARALLTLRMRYVTMARKFLEYSGVMMRARFLGKDPASNVGESPTLFATDRTDRKTYIAQGWRVSDPQVLADVGPVPSHEALIEIPEEVLRFYVRRYQEEEGN